MKRGGLGNGRKGEIRRTDLALPGLAAPRGKSRRVFFLDRGCQRTDQVRLHAARPPRIDGLDPSEPEISSTAKRRRLGPALSYGLPTTACVLCALARDGDWRPVDRWREALRAWSEEKHLKRSWRYMAPVLASAPDDVLQISFAWRERGLMDIAEPFDHHEALFFDLCRRVLAIDDGDDANGDENDFTGRAIDHPIGQVTEALLNWWHRSRLEDGQGLPDRLKPIFTELCDARVDKFRHGRVFLAPHVVTLFRVDREWAERHMLPLFDWRRCETEARAAWEGFLWSPRLYRPLMESIKEPFLDTHAITRRSTGTADNTPPC